MDQVRVLGMDRISSLVSRMYTMPKQYAENAAANRPSSLTPVGSRHPLLFCPFVVPKTRGVLSRRQDVQEQQPINPAP
jgi:hypothetical protein